jgi:hypothetical protein
MINKTMKIWLCMFIVLLLTACSGQRVMMPTPNEAVGKDTTHYENLNPELKSTEVPLFYITDRVPEKDGNGNLEYGYGRSPSLAFGKTVVDLGQDLSCVDLLEESRTL